MVARLAIRGVASKSRRAGQYAVMRVRCGNSPQLDGKKEPGGSRRPVDTANAGNASVVGLLALRIGAARQAELGELLGREGQRLLHVRDQLHGLVDEIAV